MAKTETKIEPKTIALIAGVVILVAFALWQVTRATTGASSDVTYTPKVKPPPESARPPGFEKPGGGAAVPGAEGKALSGE